MSAARPAATEKPNARVSRTLNAPPSPSSRSTPDCTCAVSLYFLLLFQPEYDTFGPESGMAAINYNRAMPPERFFQDTIALVYDFDGTLSPQPMQEYTVLPKIGIEPTKFWQLVNREARETESDPMLVYMRHIIEALEREKVDVK